MKKFKVKVEYNPPRLNSAIDLVFEVDAMDHYSAKQGMFDLVSTLYIAGVDGLRVTDIEEIAS